MKVLFVSNLFPDSADPVRGRVNATLLRQMAEKAEVRVVALRPSLPFVGKNFDRLQPCEEDKLLHPVFRTVAYVPKIGSRVNHRLLAARAQATLHRVKYDFPYDVILCSWLYPDVCGIARLLRGLGRPMVGISQGTDTHQYLNNKFRRKLIVRTVNRIGGVITRSKDIAKRLGDAGVKEEKLFPIYNGVNNEIFHPGDQVAARGELNLPNEAKIITYVGNFLAIKNPLLLVRAHAALRQLYQDQPVHLVLIGAGPLKSDIETAVRELGTSNLVHPVGQKSAAEVAQYMRAADIHCIPSDNEGVPNVGFEALACGKPVVATKVGGIPEIVDQDYLGTLVSRGDEQGLTEALADHISSPRSGDRIATHASQFSWSKTVDAYLDVLEGAVDR